MLVYIEILASFGFLLGTFIVEMRSSEALCFALVHRLQCILLLLITYSLSNFLYWSLLAPSFSVAHVVSVLEKKY